MIARVASFEGIDVAAAQGSLEEANSIIHPLLEGLDGYRGALELLSPDGKFMSIALFDSQSDAEAAEPTFDQELPAKLGHIFEQWAGRRVSVDRYEVASDSRP